MQAERQQGFTLIELLVTLVIGMVLLLALGASLTAITRSQQLVDDYEQIQETLRFTTAVMSRGLRSSQGILETSSTGQETSDNRLVIQRSATTDNQRTACNGALKDEDFEEIYSITEQGRLLCTVVASQSSPPVTLAYGLESLDFECMLYDATEERDFSDSGDLQNCGSVNADEFDRVIAVRININLDSAEMKRLGADVEHSFIVTLRNHLNSLR